MGRTNPTFRDRLRALRTEFDDYRRALRRHDRPHFDRLFEHASAHADACGYLNHDAPVVPVLLSIALEQEAHLAALEARLDDLEAEVGVDADESRPVADSQTHLAASWADRDAPDGD